MLHNCPFCSLFISFWGARAGVTNAKAKSATYLKPQLLFLYPKPSRGVSKEKKKKKIKTYPAELRKLEIKQP